MQVAVDPEIESSTFQGLLEFLYAGTIPLEKRTNEKHLSHLLSLAEKLRIPILKEACTTDGTWPSFFIIDFQLTMPVHFSNFQDNKWKH